MNEFDFPNPVETEAEVELDQAALTRVDSTLSDDDVGGKIVRGGVVRTAGYIIGTLTNVLASVFLLRYLGVAAFGSYVTVMSVVSIAGGIADGGLTAVGNRELALLQTVEERKSMVSKLLGMRMVITPAVVVIAVLFTVIAGYPSELVIGTALAGLGATVVAISAAIALPLAVDMKIVGLTSLEVVKQVFYTLAVLVLVLAGAGLIPFFAAAIPGAIIAIAITPVVTGRAVLGLPSFRMTGWGELIKKALPIALSTIVGVIYLRFLTILMYQFSTETETGLFGTAARLVEAVSGVPLLAFMVALPALTVADDANRERTRELFQKMCEVGMIASWLIATALFLGAKPIIELLGGAEYLDAVPVLQIQCFALVGSLLAIACMMAAIAMNMRRTIFYANMSALVTVLVIGVPCVLLWGAKGAAAATVVGEWMLGLGYVWLIGREDKSVQPSLAHTWKGVFATGIAIGVALLSGTSDLIATIIGLVVFTIIALVTRAVPPEVFDALGIRRSTPSS